MRAVAGCGASFTVSCRVRGQNSTGRAYDLTQEGCLLDSGNRLITAGDEVWLRFGCGIRVSGRATLLHGRIARVEFQPPLHEAILNHLSGDERAAVAPAERCFTRSLRIAGAARR